MSIHIKCPSCGTDYDVNDDLRGKKIRCRSCEEPIAVKGASGIKGGEPSARKSAAPSGRREQDEDEAPPRKSAAPSRRRDEDEEPRARKSAPSRRRDEDDDDDDSRPRKRQGKDSEQLSKNVLMLVGGLLAAFVVIGGAVAVIIVIMIGKGTSEVPVAVNNGPRVFPPVPGPPPGGPGQFQPPPQFQPPNQNPPANPNRPKTEDKPKTDDTPKTEDTPVTGRPSSERVYERVCKSTVLMMSLTKIGDKVRVGQGSGTLIDATNRLVLTNEHVVEGSKEMAVFFQAFANGRRIGEMSFFMEQLKAKKTEVIRGRVLYTKKRVDLALVQLDRLPPDTPALAIANTSPAVTNQVLSVGHPLGIGGGGLWVHTSGEIRQFQQRRKWRAGDEKNYSDHEADVILTNSQTNHGDSGGPLVNMRAQLVGVTQGGLRDANALSIFIDLPEVQRVVKDFAAQSGMKLALETSSGVGGDTSGLPKLLTDLNSTDAQVRIRAAVALGEMGEDAKKAIPALFKALKDPDDNVVREAAQALRAVGTPTRDDAPMFIAALQDENRRVRGCALEELAKMGPEARPAAAKLAEILKAKETDAELRQQAARCLGQIGAAAATQGVPALVEALKDPEPIIREAAADALGKFGVEARTTASSLLAMLADKETTVRRAALGALAQIGPEAKETLPKLKPALKDADPESRRRALDVLGRLGTDAVKDKEALAALNANLNDPEFSTNALNAVAKIGPPAKQLAKELVRHLKDPPTRLTAVTTLGTVLEKVKLTQTEIKNFRPVLDELINQFEVQDNTLRDKTVESLGKIGPAAVFPLYQALQKAAQNDLPTTRLGIVRALGAIGRDAQQQEVIIALTQLSRRDPSPLVRDACDKALQRIQ
jgi:predicted Zn finger-like uncharacterized protein